MGERRIETLEPAPSSGPGKKEVRISSDLSDWESMRSLAVKIISQCEERAVLAPRRIEWVRSPYGGVEARTSTFTIERDGYATQWVIPDWEMDRFGAEWMDFVTDRLVTSFSSRAADPEGLSVIQDPWLRALVEDEPGGKTGHGAASKKGRFLTAEDALKAEQEAFRRGFDKDFILK